MDADDTLPGGSDRRISPRKQMIKRVQLSFASWTTECAVLDISDRGARLAHHTPVIVPDFLTVRLPNGQTRMSRVRWRAADTFGVEFVE